MTLHNRTAEVAYDGTDLTPRGMKVNIDLKLTLPLISMSQSMGVGTSTDDKNVVDDIYYNRAIERVDQGTPTLADFKGYLIDTVYKNKTGEDRYLGVAIVSAIGAHSVGYIFYDKKYQDLILIPELRSFGDTETSKEFMKGYTLNIEGYKIGLNGSRFLETFVAAPSPQKLALPEVTTQIHTVVHKMLTYNTRDGGTQLFDNYGVTLNQGYLESKAAPMMDFVSLGSAATVFGDNPVPTYRMINTSMRNSGLAYVGMQKPDDILIPLPW